MKRALSSSAAPAGTFRWTEPVANALLRVESQPPPPPPAAGTAVAAFDLDGTLISVASGAKFYRDADDWRLRGKGLRGVLADCVRRGQRVLVLSNQAGVAAKRVSRDEVSGAGAGPLRVLTRNWHRVREAAAPHDGTGPSDMYRDAQSSDAWRACSRRSAAAARAPRWWGCSR